MKCVLVVLLGLTGVLCSAHANECNIGENRAVVDYYWPNPSEHLDLVHTIEEQAQCFSKSVNICEVGEIYHKQDGYTGDHTAYFIILNSRLVFLATTPYYDGTYGSEWGTPQPLTEAADALNKIKSATQCGSIGNSSLFGR